MPKRHHTVIDGYLESYLAPSAQRCQREAEVGVSSLTVSVFASLSCSVSSTLDFHPTVASFSYLLSHLSHCLLLSIWLLTNQMAKSVCICLYNIQIHHSHCFCSYTFRVTDYCASCFHVFGFTITYKDNWPQICANTPCKLMAGWCVYHVPPCRAFVRPSGSSVTSKHRNKVHRSTWQSWHGFWMARCAACLYYTRFCHQHSWQGVKWYLLLLAVLKTVTVSVVQGSNQVPQTA